MIFIYCLSTSFSSIRHLLDDSEWIFDIQILWLGICSDYCIEFLCQINIQRSILARHVIGFDRLHSHVGKKKKVSKW